MKKFSVIVIFILWILFLFVVVLRFVQNDSNLGVDSQSETVISIDGSNVPILSESKWFPKDHDESYRDIVVDLPVMGHLELLYVPETNTLKSDRSFKDTVRMLYLGLVSGWPHYGHGPLDPNNYKMNLEFWGDETNDDELADLILSFCEQNNWTLDPNAAKEGEIKIETWPVITYKELISLEEWEESRKNLWQNITEAKNGIACPECGEELYDDCTLIITTNPARIHIFCKDCEWTGTRTE